MPRTVCETWFTVAWLHQRCTTVGCQVTMATFLYLSAYSFDMAPRFLSNSCTLGHRPSTHFYSNCRNHLASELWGVGTSSLWPWTVPLRLPPLWFRDALRGHHFASDQEVKESVHAWCATQPKTLFSHGIQKLVHFWTTCIEKQEICVGRWFAYTFSIAVCCRINFKKYIVDNSWLTYIYLCTLYTYVCVCVFVCVYNINIGFVGGSWRETDHWW